MPHPNSLRTIPRQDHRRIAKVGYRNYPLLPVETPPLMEVRNHGLMGRNHYAAAHNPPYEGPIPGAIEELLVRPSVLEMLINANQRLAAAGLGLWLYDGWRPTELQAHFHHVWMPERLRAKHPNRDEAWIAKETLQYWAAPTVDKTAPSPHLTGGAVDVTLCHAATGEHLWMGCLFDDVDAIAAPDHYENPDNVRTLSDEVARGNRRILYWSMADAGFCGHPDEIWHYSYGDQMWAKLGGHPHAFYGPTSPAS